MAQKKSNSKPVKEKELKEECRKCGSSDFSIGEDENQRRYCGKCNNVWGPMSEEDIKVLAVQKDNAMLKDVNSRLSKRVAELEKTLLASV